MKIGIRRSGTKKLEIKLEIIKVDVDA